MLCLFVVTVLPWSVPAARADFHLLAQQDAPTPDIDPSAGSAPSGSGGDPAPPNVVAPDQEEEKDGGADSIAVEEVNAFDPWAQWLTVSLGFFRNSGVNGAASSYFAGGGMRYALTVLDRFIADSNSAQDSLAIEGGAFYYRVVNFLSVGDSYTLVPLIGTVRYNLAFSETFTVFFYAGFMVNEVLQASNATGKVGLALQTPAAGTGFFLRIGPNWDLRADIGSDVFQMGLVLRF